MKVENLEKWLFFLETASYQEGKKTKDGWLGHMCLESPNGPIYDPFGVACEIAGVPFVIANYGEHKVRKYGKTREVHQPPVELIEWLGIPRPILSEPSRKIPNFNNLEDAIPVGLTTRLIDPSADPSFSIFSIDKDFYSIVQFLFDERGFSFKDIARWIRKFLLSKNNQD